MPEIQTARPPYVQFELRPVEDRAASTEKGHYVAKDVAFAIVTPAGSKDRIEKIAEEWLTNMAEQVRQERLPQEWLTHYRVIYKAWKEGLEIPENGTAVRTWAVVSPAQISMLTSLGIRTVEDLADANEEAIGRLGMGGRMLKQKAIDWLASANSLGKGVEAVTTLRAENAAQALQIAALQASVAGLERALLAHASQPGGQQSEPDDPDDIKLNVVPTASMKKL